MLQSIQDLIDIDYHISSITEKRDALADRLKRLKDKEDDFFNKMDELDKRLDEAAREISEIEKLEDIPPLRLKYGQLEILDTLEGLFQQRENLGNEKLLIKEMSQLTPDTDDLVIKLTEIHSKVMSLKLISGIVHKSFNDLLTSYSSKLINAFKSELLNSKWDSEYFVSSKKSITSLRQQSSDLYTLQKLLLKSSNKAENDQLWNFQCISNNFLIKYMYHFSNPKSEELAQNQQSIELYFKFLDRYLEANLYHCIDIFTDEHSGLSKDIVHKEFINHTLSPIRSKINQTLLYISENQTTENLKTMIILISQIFINDNALIEKYYYNGIGLVSLLPSTILEAWLAFESESTLNQYERIIASPTSKNGIDLVKLLENMYRYFEPCFNIEYDHLDSYKLQIVSRVFLELINRYNKFITSADPSLSQLSDEKQLETTFWKLNNALQLHDCVMKFRFKSSFIELTFIFNSLSKSSYESIFSESLAALDETIVTIRESIIHRSKKLLKYSLNGYLRLNTWQSVTSSPTECSTELITAVKTVSRLRDVIERFNLPSNIVISICTELQKQWIFYLKDYVVKVNNFSLQGLQQVMVDHVEMRKSLELDSIPYPSEEKEFEEFMKVLKLKYEGKNQYLPFLTKSYISQSSEYTEVRNALDLKYISNSELDYALYKIL